MLKRFSLAFSVLLLLALLCSPLHAEKMYQISETELTELENIIERQNKRIETQQLLLIEQAKQINDFKLSLEKAQQMENEQEIFWNEFAVDLKQTVQGMQDENDRLRSQRNISLTANAAQLILNALFILLK